MMYRFLQNVHLNGTVKLTLKRTYIDNLIPTTTRKDTKKKLPPIFSNVVFEIHLPHITFSKRK